MHASDPEIDEMSEAGGVSACIEYLAEEMEAKTTNIAGVLHRIRQLLRLDERYPGKLVFDYR